MNSMLPLDADIAVLLDRLEPPALSDGFADRLLAAAEASAPAPLPRLRKRPRLRRIAVGIAAAGAISVAAAAAIVPEDVLRRLPVIGEIVDWVAPEAEPDARDEPAARLPLELPLPPAASLDPVLGGPATAPQPEAEAISVGPAIVEERRAATKTASTAEDRQPERPGREIAAPPAATPAREPARGSAVSPAQTTQVRQAETSDQTERSGDGAAAPERVQETTATVRAISPDVLSEMPERPEVRRELRERTPQTRPQRDRIEAPAGRDVRPRERIRTRQPRQ